MSEPSTRNRTLLTLPVGELPFGDTGPSTAARRREGVNRLALLGADIVAVAAALLLVALLTDAGLTVWVVALIPLYALLSKAAGLYDRDQFVLSKTTLDEAPTLVAVTAIFVLFVEGVRALEFTGRSHPFLMWGMLTGAAIVARWLARFLAVRTASTERVLVIGDAPTTAMLRRKIGGDPGINAEVIGRIPLQPGLPEEDEGDMLGRIEDLYEVLEEHRPERAIVAPAREGTDVSDVIRLLTACGVRVSVLPRMLEVIGTTVEFDDLGGRPLLGVRGFGLSPSSRFLKRTFDIVVASTFLLVISPFLLLIVILVKLSSPGPVIFRQTRVGRDGHEFRMLKFRTMVFDADERKMELLEDNEAAPLFKIADDPRATRVGRFLRRNSLDELPQLINVLRGDMSMVGPRPLIVDEDRLFSGWQRRRYHVSPGITGPWQILGSSRVPVSDMVSLDYLYCANWSLWLDA
ncbi:MAG: sugar transferase, partial [Thermoleophilaceae bacterium]|nr:sugar transferase [Thermoleophilaceae bacterium]